jgi:hypothetical protein
VSADLERLDRDGAASRTRVLVELRDASADVDLRMVVWKLDDGASSHVR